MAKKQITSPPLVDNIALDKQFDKYQLPQTPIPQSGPAYRDPRSPMPVLPPGQGAGADRKVNPEDQLMGHILAAGTGKEGGGKQRSANLDFSRYDSIMPGEYDNEDAYGQGQAWYSKMANGVGKGLVLTGTTFLQSTAGLIYGIGSWNKDGRAASFYDNDFTRSLDNINKWSEDAMPNYYTNSEKNARWYAPSKLASANFLWDGIVKNLGFAAGAALSGMAYTSALKALPLANRLFTVGKGADVLARSEAALFKAGKSAAMHGELVGLANQFSSQYNVLNTAGRGLVAALATTGEAGIESFHNLNETRDGLIADYKKENGGLAPEGADLDKINATADDVGNSSFWLNASLLTVTNYIQFPKILGSSYKGEKGLINGLARESGNIVRTSEKGAARQVWKIKEAKKGVDRVLATLNKIRPYTFSVSEAIEEGSQFAISKGTMDYYNKKYSGDAYDILSSVAEGLNETFGSDEGMESILIGGLSGSIMLGRGRWRQASAKQKNTRDLVKGLNTYQISDFSEKTIESVVRGVSIQEEREALLKEGDEFGSKTEEAKYIHNYLLPRIKFGRMDLVRADIEEYTKLASTENGFAALQEEGKALKTEKRENYLARIGRFQQVADNMEALYQSITLRYGGLVGEDGKVVYPESVLEKMMYAGTMIDDFSNRISQTESKVPLDVHPILDDIVEGKEESYEAAKATIIADASLVGEKQADALQA